MSQDFSAKHHLDPQDDIEGSRTAGGAGPVRPDSPASWGPPSSDHDEESARRMEESGRFRVLRSVPPRPVVPLNEAIRDGRRVALILDTETTGLDHRRCELIELGMVLCTFDDNGLIHDVVETFSAFHEPTGPLPAAITSLTGITDEMLRGQRIDSGEVARFASLADLVIAHNARFDRPFCEALHPCFEEKAWGCSLKDVDWGPAERDGLRLSQLLATRGFFHRSHRALDDCFALIEVLNFDLRGITAMDCLMRKAAEDSFEIRAERAPYDSRHLLKSRGYRWSPGSDGLPKAWVVEVPASKHAAEIRFLETDVYRGAFSPVWRRLDARTRYGRVVSTSGA